MHKENVIGSSMSAGYRQFVHQKSRSKNYVITSQQGLSNHHAVFIHFIQQMSADLKLQLEKEQTKKKKNADAFILKNTPSLFRSECVPCMCGLTSLQPARFHRVNRWTWACDAPPTASLVCFALEEAVSDADKESEYENKSINRLLPLSLLLLLMPEVFIQCSALLLNRRQEVRGHAQEAGGMLSIISAGKLFLKSYHKWPNKATCKCSLCDFKIQTLWLLCLGLIKPQWLKFIYDIFYVSSSPLPLFSGVLM